jgi:hypothetical protein
MAPKRTREEDNAPSAAKKQRKGFSVGPANLPDGTYKRKGAPFSVSCFVSVILAVLTRPLVQKIKKDLIHKAKIKKEYAKVKTREQPVSQTAVYERAAEAGELPPTPEPAEPVPEPTLEPHPDRLKLLEKTSPEPDHAPAFRPGHRNKRPRPQPFKNETELARKRKEEAEARRKAREDAERERQKKIAERERMRKAMAKARGGPDGKRKLGRESTVLLEKVKRMVNSA